MVKIPYLGEMGEIPYLGEMGEIPYLGEMKRHLSLAMVSLPYYIYQRYQSLKTSPWSRKVLLVTGQFVWC